MKWIWSMTIGHLRCPHYASCLHVRRRVILINEGLPVLNLRAKRWSDLYFPKQDTGRSDFRTLPFVLELDIEQAGSPVSLARESFPWRSVDRWSPGRIIHQQIGQLPTAQELIANGAISANLFYFFFFVLTLHRNHSCGLDAQ